MGRLPGPQKVFLLLFAPLVYAAKTAEPWAICSESCQACLQPVHFNDTQLSDLNIVQSCQSGLGLYSTYLCLEIYCGSEYRRLALQERNETCQSALGLSIPPFSIVANLTSDNAADVRRITEDDVFDPSNPAREIVLPALDFFTAWYDTLVSGLHCRTDTGL
ncbi:hypothetical protein QQS21_005611 [Conoideocrella luteorostrata]|uniref:Uncharacterized protein n=1 Tax=Conoideocrella luteorostrata TaxID=1105319 RepID=A0AAJ0CTF0_9HYPO|nr:hypothetical protein QQS21_005611 [Conoideocrella luteorostrata]